MFGEINWFGSIEEDRSDKQNGVADVDELFTRIVGERNASTFDLMHHESSSSMSSLNYSSQSKKKRCAVRAGFVSPFHPIKTYAKNRTRWYIFGRLIAIAKHKSIDLNGKWSTWTVAFRLWWRERTHTMVT